MPKSSTDTGGLTSNNVMSLIHLVTDWFLQLKQESPGVTMREAGARHIQQFTSPLGENILRKTLTVTKKRRAETYVEYASRLLDIADSLPGSCGFVDNGRQAAFAFVEHGHPAYKKDLDRHARKKIAKGVHARLVLDMVVTVLIVFS
ncbi:uncharacterized protein IUM83_04572 [Phytophthora cinnamomi]|uniref:uncharacterized protein n=1 Tax=Phytophthora cinnamomi TaxID=4785 RepID=UPI00355A00CC|nr:hypothetical protein IUM83_04572 [Phytophthora cinnamomi]